MSGSLGYAFAITELGFFQSIHLKKVYRVREITCFRF